MRQQLRQFLVRHGVEAEDITAAGAALVVSGVQQRRLVAFEGGRHRVARVRGDRPGDRDDLVALDQLVRPLDRGLGVGLVVFIDDLDRVAHDAAGLVDLLYRQVQPQLGLAAIKLQPAAERLHRADLDRRPGRDRRKAQRRCAGRRAGRERGFDRCASCEFSHGRCSLFLLSLFFSGQRRLAGRRPGSVPPLKRDLAGKKEVY